jgi:hypothetical protein
VSYNWKEIEAIARGLEQATEQMNEAICEAEDTFLEKLGEGARGRVEIQRGETGRKPWVDFLAYHKGEFFIETNRGGNRFSSIHILSASREMRILACSRLKALWEVCGGNISTQPSSGVGT